MENLNNYTDAYDEVFTLDNRLMINGYVNRIVDVANGESALDLGIGHGYTVDKLEQKFGRYVVLEGSNKIIDRFKEYYPESKAEIIEVYFEDYYTTEKFDNIIMGFILEHIDDPMLILNKYKQYLKPNGSIFVAVPNGECLHRRIGYEAGLLDNMIRLSESDYRVGHKRYFTLNSLKELVMSAGYKVTKEEGLFLKVITTNQMKKLEFSEEIYQAMMTLGRNYPELSNGILLEIKVVE